MANTCEIPLLFKDDDAEPAILRDTALIKLIPTIVRAVELKNPNWETENVVVTSPISIPFPRWTGDFIFDHIRKYESPQGSVEGDIKNYPEAAQKTIVELKQIIGLADFLECTSFMHCIGFVIADKLSPKHVDEIAAYLGVEMMPEEELENREDGWVYPPSSIFENN
ncbi:unnamed protein product [Caenorhabditis brenneri]